MTNCSNNDDLSLRVRKEALDALEKEPELLPLLKNTVLHPRVQSFEDAVAISIAYRLSSGDAKKDAIDPHTLQQIFQQALVQGHDDGDDDDNNNNKIYLEGGHAASYAVRQDLLAVMDRDPACETILEVLLFFKGFAALVAHRVAFSKWIQTRHSMTALYLQSQCSSLFGVDIHPGATIGAGIMFDHGTGIVIGETAVIGDGCTLLHGVTLGGTGKDTGDRHPKIGQNCLLGTGASILGNISVGHKCKIGAGSVVLRSLPAGATAVGAPAKIIGRVLESNPGTSMDPSLRNVALLHNSKSTIALSKIEQLSVVLNSEDENEEKKEDTQGQVGGAYNMCPFRDYTKMSKRAPPGTITICTLRKMLLQEGCSQDEIGSIFFHLDTRNVGYIHRKAFEEFGQDAIEKYTSLKLTCVTKTLDDFLAHHPMCLSDYGKEEGSRKII